MSSSNDESEKDSSYSSCFVILSQFILKNNITIKKINNTMPVTAIEQK